jgi:hypothetical protein
LGSTWLKAEGSSTRRASIKPERPAACSHASRGPAGRSTSENSATPISARGGGARRCRVRIARGRGAGFSGAAGRPMCFLLGNRRLGCRVACGRWLHGEGQHLCRHLRGQGSRRRLRFRAARKPACPVFVGRRGSVCGYEKPRPAAKRLMVNPQGAGPIFAISAPTSRRLRTGELDKWRPTIEAAHIKAE